MTPGEERRSAHMTARARSNSPGRGTRGSRSRGAMRLTHDLVIAMNEWEPRPHTTYNLISSPSQPWEAGGLLPFLKTEMFGLTGVSVIHRVTGLVGGRAEALTRSGLPTPEVLTGSIMEEKEHVRAIPSPGPAQPS